ncbi:MAG: glucose-phosphatase, partial [Humisphaera sp.]|nr:glucose-phosphatase [Humisphaera sp.]
MSEIRLVVFDLGRVLIRICDNWRHACEVARVPMPAMEPSPEALRRIDEIAARYDTGAIDLPAFAREVAVIGGQRPQDIIALQQAYLLGPFPHAAELIDDLCRAGVKTACLSNTTENHWRMLHDPGGPNYLPLERVSYLFASYLLGLRKPDDRIYAHVEQVTGTPAREIVFFDDIEENIEAATRRGWRAHRIEIDSDPIA